MFAVQAREQRMAGGMVLGMGKGERGCIQRGAGGIRGGGKGERVLAKRVE